MNSSYDRDHLINYICIKKIRWPVERSILGILKTAINFSTLELYLVLKLQRFDKSVTPIRCAFLKSRSAIP